MRPALRAVAGAAGAGLRPAWPALRAAAAPAALTAAGSLAFVALAPDRWPGWAAALLAVPLVRLLDDPAGVLATASPTSLPRRRVPRLRSRCRSPRPSGSRCWR